MALNQRLILSKLKILFHLARAFPSKTGSGSKTTTSQLSKTEFSIKYIVLHIPK